MVAGPAPPAQSQRSSHSHLTGQSHTSHSAGHRTPTQYTYEHPCWSISVVIFASRMEHAVSVLMPGATGARHGSPRCTAGAPALLAQLGRGGSQRLDTRALECLICQRQCVGLNRVSNPAWEVTGAVLSYRRSRRGGACSPLGIQSCWLSGALGGVEKQVGRSKAVGSHLVQHLQDGYTLLQSQTVFNVGRLLVVCCLAFFLSASRCDPRRLWVAYVACKGRLPSGRCRQRRVGSRLRRGTPGMNLLPRFVRPGYLGMDRNRFNGRCGRTWSRSASGCRASPSTGLTSTPSPTTISSATGAPQRKE